MVDQRVTYATKIDPAKLEGVQPNDVIYLYTACIPEFVRHHLSHINVPITLVTGADDLSASHDVLGQEVVRELLDNELVTKWFAQNSEIAHPKLSLIPIGMDYHMLAGNHSKPWRKFQRPLDQEKELLSVLANALPASERACTAYANWHFFLDRGDRQECFDQIDHECVFFEPKMVARRQSWTHNGQHLFTISPLGNGLDCHRTWEALLLGTIPIVHTSPLDSLYEGLPVCIVNDWRDVSPAFLSEQRRIMLDRTYDFSKIYLSYWNKLLHLGSGQLRRKLTLEAFATSHV